MLVAPKNIVHMSGHMVKDSRHEPQNLGDQGSLNVLLEDLARCSTDTDKDVKGQKWPCLALCW